MNSENIDDLPPPPAYNPEWDKENIVDNPPKTVHKSSSSSTSSSSSAKSSITVRLSIVKSSFDTDL